MKLTTREDGVRVGRDVLEFAEQHLSSALDRYEERIVDVDVRLSDLNGPKGGLDKSCQVRIRVRPHGTLLVEERAENWQASIAVATDRAAHAVSREVDRVRDRAGREGLRQRA